MIINALDTRSETWNCIDLDVSVEGSVVTVSAGTFRIGGVEYTFDDDYEHDIGLPEEDVFVDGALVRVVAEGTAELVVDTRRRGEKKCITGLNGEYQLLHHLFYGKVPGGLDNLDNVTLTVHRILMSEGG